MLSAAAYAIWLADQPCAVPDTAPATFQAGVYNGFTGKDLRAQWEACFAPDQDIANDVYKMGQALEQKDWGTAKSIILAHKDKLPDDMRKCTDDPQYAAVDEAYIK